MIFDVRENLLWKSVKEQIICYKPTFIYSNKVFYREGRAHLAACPQDHQIP